MILDFNQGMTEHEVFDNQCVLNVLQKCVLPKIAMIHPSMYHFPLQWTPLLEAS